MQNEENEQHGVDGEFAKVKAEYAEKFADRVAGAASKLRMYDILLADAEENYGGVGGVRYDGLVQGSGVYVDAVHDRALRMSSSIKRWRESRKKAAFVVDAAARAFENVDDAKCHQILELKYLDGFSWRQVGDAMGYSQSTVMHLKVTALSKLYDVMPDQFKMPDHKAI